MKRRRLSENDKRLWRQVTADVVPLAPPPRTSASVADAPKTPVPDASNAQPGQTPASVAPPTTAETTPPRQRHPRPTTGLDRRTLRKLARGNMRIEARIDLHGMTQGEAHNALIRFITHSAARKRRFVLVITGKGVGGEGRGVLRRAVPHWLDGATLSRHVVAYRPAQPAHGGDGALYVRLRPPG